VNRRLGPNRAEIHDALSAELGVPASQVRHPLTTFRVDPWMQIVEGSCPSAARSAEPC
jgi:hypothetical protein